MNRLAVSLVAFSLALGAATAASAQGAPGAPGAPFAPPNVEQRFSHVDRQGLLIGFSLGGGSFGLADCDTCESFDGVAADFHIGAMLTQRLGLMWDVSAVSEATDDLAVTHAISTAAAQFWVTPRVWIKGGIGVGQLSVSDNNGDVVAESEVGAGVMFAAGVEVLQSRNFALDLQLRGSGVTYDENDTVSMASLTLGFNWY